VPATDEEILEVNDTDMHIPSDTCQTIGYLATDEENVEVDETDMHIASDACQTIGYLPAEGIPSRLSQIESSEAINSGLLHSDNVQPYTDQVKSRSEVSTSSKVLKIELKFMALYHFHS
jgi:hypothetical protein